MLCAEKAMAPHSSTLAWKIPWTEEPGSPWGRWVRHDSDFPFTFHFHALEKEMATHSSVAWRIPGTAEPCRLPSMGSHRVGHDWRDLAAAMLCEEKVRASLGHVPIFIDLQPTIPISVLVWQLELQSKFSWISSLSYKQKAELHSLQCRTPQAAATSPCSRLHPLSTLARQVLIQRTVDDSICSSIYSDWP